MPLLSDAQSVRLGTLMVDELFVGGELAYPKPIGQQPVISEMALDGTAVLSWTSHPSATGYKINRNNSHIATETTSEQGIISRLDSGLQWDTDYTYTITPIIGSADGTTSAASVTRRIATPRGFKPVVQYLSSSGDYLIKWKDIAGVTSYMVYRNGELVATVTSSSYQERGMGWGESYSYSVLPMVGTKPCLESVESDPIVVPYGSIPELVLAEYSHKSISISWKAVPGASSYSVFMNGVIVLETESTAYFSWLAPDTEIEIYVVPMRIDVDGVPSPTYIYHTGHEEQRDIGSLSNILFTPALIDSWRLSDAWDSLDGIAAQGSESTIEDSYLGVIYYGDGLVKSGLQTVLGSGQLGINRQQYGQSSEAELYLARELGIGSSSYVYVGIKVSNSSAQGAKPIGYNTRSVKSTAPGKGSWVDIGSEYGDAIGQARYNSLLLYQNGAKNLAYFKDCRLRLTWVWDYVTVPRLSPRWTQQ